MKKVVYTAIFGGYDFLYEPEIKPDNVDFVCFTDNKNIRLTDPSFDLGTFKL